MSVEVWKDIEGYEGLYQVSNLGRVKSLNYRHTGREQILKSIKNKFGYLYLSLHKNNKIKTYAIHRLVAQTFIENSNNYYEINHIDEDKTNNAVENLEWCTRKYNLNYGSYKQNMSKTKSKAIYCLETNKFYKSATQSAKELNINRQNIVHVLKRRNKQTEGYTFRYADQVLYKKEDV